MEFGGLIKKEGIYSPITQNQRHLELMKKIKADSKTNILMRFMVGRYFEDIYKPIVVLANPKTILNAKFAKKEVKNQVIRADQLVSYIKETCKNSKVAEESDKEMIIWAQSFLDFNIDAEKDYTSKFNEYLIKSSDNPTVKMEEAAKVEERITDAVEVTTVHENVEESEIFKELKRFRLNKSHEEKIKPYFIYNDNQLRDLISKMPVTKEELKNVAGFGDVKAAKYGDDIIRIVKKYI